MKRLQRQIAHSESHSAHRRQASLSSVGGSTTVDRILSRNVLAERLDVCVRNMSEKGRYIQRDELNTSADSNAADTLQTMGTLNEFLLAHCRILARREPQGTVAIMFRLNREFLSEKSWVLFSPAGQL